MKYLTMEEFKEKAEGVEPSAENLELAQEKIDDLTFNRIVKIGFNNLTEFQKEYVKKAMYYLIKYYEEYPDAINGNTNIGSYAVGDISVSLENAKDSSLELYGIPESSYAMLNKTGLMRRVL